jgi:hypothetical protein
MADKTNIDILINTANSATNVRELKKALKELVSAQEGVDKSSPDFSKLAAGITDTEGRIGDLNDSFKTLAGSGMERLTTSSYLLRDGLNNLDLDKIKIGLSGLKQLPKALAIEFTKLAVVIKGLNFKNLGSSMKDLSKSGVGELTKSIVQLGKAILTNPIMLLAAVIIGLVVLVVEFYDKIIPLRMAVEAFGKVIDVVVQSLKDFADWIGITDFAGDEAAQKQMDRNTKLLKDTEIKYDQEVAMAQAAGKETLLIEKEREQMMRKIMDDEVVNLTDQLNRKMIKEKEYNEKLWEIHYKYVASKNKEAVLDTQIEKEKSDKEKESLADRTKKYADFAKAKVAAEKKANEELKDLQNQAIKGEEIREKAVLKTAYERRIKDIESQIALYGPSSTYSQNLLSLRNKLNEDLSAIDVKWMVRDITARFEQEESFIDLKQKLLKNSTEDEEQNAAALRKQLESQDGIYFQHYETGLEAQTILLQQANDKKAAFDKTYEEQKKAAKDVAMLKDIEDEKLRNDVTVKAYEQAIDHYKKDYADKKEAVISARLDRDLKREIIALETQVAIYEDGISQLNSVEQKRYDNLNDKDKQYLGNKISILEKQKELELNVKGLTDREKLNITQRYEKEEFDVKKLFIDKDLEEQRKANAAKLNLAAQYVDAIKGALSSVNEIASQSLQQEKDARNAAAEEELGNMAYKTDAQVQVWTDEQTRIQESIKAEGDANGEKQAQIDALAQRKKDLQDKEAQDEYTTKLALYEFNKEIKSKEFKRNKAFQLGGAVMDTASAVMKSLASAPLAIGVIPNPVGIASMVAVIAAGIANIAKIANTKEGDAGAPPKPPILSTAPVASGGSGGGSGGGGGSGSGGNFSAPTFYKLGQGGSNMGGGMAQRVYVLESDITRTQKGIQRVETRATTTL